MGLTQDLSDLLHTDGAIWVALLAYICRGVVDALLAGITSFLGLDQVTQSITEATKKGLSKACSCCRRGPADAKPLPPEEQKRRDEAEEAQIKTLVPSAAERPRGPGVTLGNFDNMDTIANMSWEKTLAESGRSRCRGVVEAAVRALFWHALQPSVYLAALCAFWGELGPWQRVFGGIVALREVLYLVGTGMVAVVQPSFLLVDIVASWKETSTSSGTGPSGVAMYVLAPEKLLFFAVGDSFPSGSLMHNLFGYCMLGTILTDLFAIGALAAALHSGVTPPALMVGYCMTTLAAVTAIMVLIFE